MLNAERQLTKNFKLSEFAVSANHPNLIKDTLLSEKEVTKLYFLSKTILEPTREFSNHGYACWGGLIITSGKRTKVLNKKEGGSISSDHLFEGYSCACDFYLSLCNEELIKVYDYMKRQVPSFGQLIYYPKKGIIHVSLPTEKHQGESWIEN